jgi:hypothetical protein
MHLKDSPYGAERFNIGRTFVSFSLAINLIALNGSCGGWSLAHGPATNFVLTQVAIASVIISPLRIAEFAFSQTRPGSCF